ncbi:MAG: Sec-independent protein translocase protein TatB [Pseudomonadota bacterium]|jgi:sec-independent protein translocase protein TatB
MFDVGFSELLLIALVALVVFGPERLPKLVKETTYWIRKVRGTLHSAKSEIDRELQLMELRATMEDRRKKFLAEAEALGMQEHSILNPERRVTGERSEDEEKRGSD